MQVKSTAGRPSYLEAHRTGSWARKHLASLRSAYGRTPFFEEHEQFLAAHEPHLSAFDLLFSCGPKAAGILRRWLRPPA